MDDTAIIVAKSAGSLTVKEGATTQAEWGKPFSLEFSASKTDNKINVTPSLRVKGKAGEIYTGFTLESYNSLPEVFLIVDGKPTKLGAMEFG